MISGGSQHVTHMDHGVAPTPLHQPAAFYHRIQCESSLSLPGMLLSMMVVLLIFDMSTHVTLNASHQPWQDARKKYLFVDLDKLCYCVFQSVLFTVLQVYGMFGMLLTACTGAVCR